ncbi:MAG: helix-turn-helix transcriptional regulator [Lentilactobacillus buchneri]|jgi:DNA-binding HxlR family transcriptional regulator|nr:helix-turn-helix transcriptional regulator [Lentilactobacillus buchneri]
MNTIQSSTKHHEFCPLDTTLEILSGKWKSIIICRLMSKDRRFSDLKRTMPSCTKRMLALQLNQLEESKIVHRDVFADTVPIKTVYSLTSLGKTLVPIINSMNNWGSHYIKIRETATTTLHSQN